MPMIDDYQFNRIFSNMFANAIETNHFFIQLKKKCLRPEKTQISWKLLNFTWNPIEIHFFVT